MRSKRRTKCGEYAARNTTKDPAVHVYIIPMVRSRACKDFERESSSSQACQLMLCKVLVSRIY